MFDLSVNCTSNPKEISDSFVLFVNRFRDSFAKGDISEDQKDFVVRKINELRRFGIVANDSTLNSELDLKIQKSIEAELLVFGEKDVQRRIEEFSKSFTSAMIQAKKIEELVLKNLTQRSDLNVDSRVSITSANRKMVQAIFSSVVEEILQPFQKALQHLDILFCEKRVSSGVEIFNRKISRSQQQELKNFVKMKKEECESFLNQQKISLESVNKLEDLFSKSLGFVEMREISKV